MVYPRTRGEACAGNWRRPWLPGLPPHTRGSRFLLAFGLGVRGSTPAHAGKPRRPARARARPAVYPRTRGEARPAGASRRDCSGLPPHTRGSRRDGLRAAHVRGSTPAHAGKPHRARHPREDRGVYPRTRGEASGRARAKLAPAGLPPHTRGSPSPVGPVHDATGSTPAHAGKPGPPCPHPPIVGVYPRTRGEAILEPVSGRLDDGLPPHTRGSLGAVFADGEAPGSTPAHAGKPPDFQVLSPHARVYPRTRGEASTAAETVSCAAGLPPHTRGSRLTTPSAHGSTGSTPAHAGKPEQSAPCRSVRRVYPRTRGEAISYFDESELRPGLPPHTRGSLEPVRATSARRGSTPAHAGKPDPFGPTGRWRAVYPRTRGEATEVVQRGTSLTGLPPHTRGSRPDGGRVAAVRGSTPAHAGKPPGSPGCRDPPAVYPRTRGEACSTSRETSPAWGLPPHTRGSQHPDRRRRHRLRSTPAHAGKPLLSAGWTRVSGVYPRTRGEAVRRRNSETTSAGLPPHTRGSLLWCDAKSPIC